MNLLLLLLSCLLLGNAGALKRPFLRAYECKNKNCQRTGKPIDSESSLGINQHLSIQACRLVCSTVAGIWPLPTGSVKTGSNYIPIHPDNFKIQYVKALDDPARDFMTDAVDVFMNNVRSHCEDDCLPAEQEVKVFLSVESSSLSLNWKTNEAYDLEISSDSYQARRLKSNRRTGSCSSSVIISAQTVYGARHALETLSQLIASAAITNGTRLLMIDSANIRDKPVFAHRGLLIDTGRNYLSRQDIERTIDALAAAKMNVLHWHATDSQSFPLQLRQLPLMAQYGAYGPDKIYTPEDQLAIKKYAQARGVRVILEIDSPSHAGNGWQWGKDLGLGNLAVCVDQQPWRSYCIQPPCGQLNPINSNIYTVLRTMYRELMETFGRNGVMHVGGDELFLNCWRLSKEVVDGMERMGLKNKTEDFMKLWAEVHNTQVKILNEESKDEEKKAIVWSSQLTEPEVIEQYLDKKKFIVQTWVEANKDLNKKLLDLGYQLIISTKDAWYLDHGFWGTTKYHSWRDAYNNVIPQREGVLGGEVCMWGEYVTGGGLDARIWPRAAAVAERLWSDPSKKRTTAEALTRLQGHVERITQRGIAPDALAPEWCSQHEAQCL